jgi:hypothetical protein
LAASELTPAGATAAAEVIDSTARRIARLVVAAGETSELDLAPGSYTVRVTLPSGTELDSPVVVVEGPVASVEIAGPTSRPRPAGELLRHREPESYSATLWEAEKDGSWHAGEELRLSSTEPTTIRLDPSRNQILAVVHEEAVEQLVALPPAAVVEVEVDTGPGGSITPQVRIDSAPAEALSAYLGAGMLDESATLVDSLLGRMGTGERDVSLETLLGYALIRMSDHGRLHQWAARPRSGAAIPDQLIIEGWSLLRRQQRGPAQANFLLASENGPPAYQDGLRLLLDGLSMLVGDRDDSPAPGPANQASLELDAALSRTREYGLAADIRSPVVSFTGVHPEEPAQPAPASRRPAWARVESPSLAFSERRLKRLLELHAGAGLIVAAILLVLLVAAPHRHIALSTVAFTAVVAALAGLGAADVRRFGWLSLVMACGWLALMVSGVAAWIGGRAEGIVLGGVRASTPVTVSGGVVLGGVVSCVLVVWGLAAARAAAGLRVLRPAAYYGLVALADALLDPLPGAPSPEEVAHAVDDYSAGLDRAGRRQLQLALTMVAIAPLRWLRAPLPALHRDARRRFLRQRMALSAAGRWPTGVLAPTLRRAIMSGSELVYLAYYGDPRSWPALGVESNTLPWHSSKRARTLPVPPRGGRAHYDAVVIGSGLAGAMAAYSLAERGRRVLVLERGPAVDLGSGGSRMYLGLYGADRAEASESNLRVRRAYAVGGAAVLGQPVDFGLPTPRPWAAAASGLDAERFAAAAIEARERAGVIRTDDRGSDIDPLALGLAKLGLGRTFAVCEQWEMLSPLLARAQSRFPGLIEVLANCDIERIETERDFAVAVRGRHASGLAVRIPTTFVVVTSGVLGSSELLRRSGLGGPGVGEDVWANLSCDVTAEFRDPISAVAARARTLRPRESTQARDALSLESGAYPPAMQALALPGWREDRFEHMRDYRRMTRAAAVIPALGPGRLAWGRRGPRFDRHPSDRDEERLRGGMLLAGRALLAAGAMRILPDSPTWHEYRDPEGLTGLENHERRELRVTARDLCGGNAIGTVVDTDLRVRGIANVYVLDASVLQAATGGHIQAVAMGIARYGATAIADAHPVAARRL